MDNCLLLEIPEHGIAYPVRSMRVAYTCDRALRSRMASLEWSRLRTSKIRYEPSGPINIQVNYDDAAAWLQYLIKLHVDQLNEVPTGAWTLVQDPGRFVAPDIANSPFVLLTTGIGTLVNRRSLPKIKSVLIPYLRERGWKDYMYGPDMWTPHNGRWLIFVSGPRGGPLWAADKPPLQIPSLRQ